MNDLNKKTDMKQNTFKCRIEYDYRGDIKITSYSNQQIPGHLFNLLNTAVHQMREKYNHEAEWKKYYIRFYHDGHIYEQDDAVDHCKGCAFSSIVRCKHPYYLSGTKGDCTDKIYKQK